MAEQPETAGVQAEVEMDEPPETGEDNNAEPAVAGRKKKKGGKA